MIESQNKNLIEICKRNPEIWCNKRAEIQERKYQYQEFIHYRKYEVENIAFLAVGSRLR
jgi:hypothetical protein